MQSRSEVEATVQALNDQIAADSARIMAAHAESNRRWAMSTDTRGMTPAECAAEYGSAHNPFGIFVPEGFQS